MNIQLIQGEFSSGDAVELVTQLIHIKIKYHENKIAKDVNEEDIKYRESKIKRLQQELYEFRKSISQNGQKLKLEAVISADFS
ncbi:hypothetical protein [Emticicia sp. 17c]|uniref:hypothetical protein n=1 Tax=Emticicia sp. 17c TaxID=3127704 RepID=UPI00301E4086